MRNLVFLPAAWEDYLWWQSMDKRILKRVNLLLQDMQRSPYDGIGKPEGLKGDLSGWWSRRIDDTHRMVYKAEGNALIIAACRTHYES